MHLVQALRRSLKSDKDRVNHVSITPKTALAIVPPKKVALPDARGLVPVAFFQALGKTERDSGQLDKSPEPVRAPDHDSGYSDHSGSGMSVGTETARSSKTMGKVSGAMVYGIVMYDFAAERPDELDAKAGEAIIVIAQSNPEWFVAKPIGRLGGPGLIPVSFIEIRDMSSGQAVQDASEAVHRAGVPKVEEWKKMAADYKNSSITLGKFEVPSGPQSQQSLEQGLERMSLQQGQQQNGYQQQQQIRQSQQARGQNQQQQPQPNAYASRSASQLYAPISAKIPRYCFAEDKYWFVIEAVLEDGRHWELSRYYEDFYDFQIALLTEFPAEAGNTPQQKRSLPYMPGPVSYVTDAITGGRQQNLDAYVKNLLTQPPYISRCTLVKQFFAPREGDFEIDPNAANEEYRLSADSQQSSTDSHTNGTSRQSSRGNLNGGYGGLSAAPSHQREQSSLSQTNGGLQPRQTSSLSQPSNQSISPGLGGQPPSAMKVKIYFGDDLIAIRVPTDIQYHQLYEKIRERLKIPPGEEIALFYKDEKSGERPGLLSNNDLDFALQRNDKLIIYVE
ncbi:scd2/ral3 [Diplocarpon rosae]|nr:scd2/ral3 [Diplocarpon rosae]